MSKRPKPEDYFDKPVTDEEITGALDRLVMAEVRAARTRKYREDLDRWNYENTDTR